MSTDQNLFTPYGDATFCEDIRHEISGQVSLIGVYRSDIIVPELPFVLPKFAVSVTVVMPPLGKVDHKIELNVYVPGDTKTASIVIKNNIDADKLPPTRGDRESDIPPHVKIVQQFIVSPFEVSQLGFVKVRIKVNEFYIKAGVIRINAISQLPPDPRPNLKFSRQDPQSRDK